MDSEYLKNLREIIVASFSVVSEESMPEFLDSLVKIRKCKSRIQVHIVTSTSHSSVIVIFIINLKASVNNFGLFCLMASVYTRNEKMQLSEIRLGNADAVVPRRGTPDITIAAGRVVYRLLIYLGNLLEC
jgi:hypothetical protein